MQSGIFPMHFLKRAVFKFTNILSTNKFNYRGAACCCVQSILESNLLEVKQYYFKYGFSRFVLAYHSQNYKSRLSVIFTIRKFHYNITVFSKKVMKSIGFCGQ